MRDTKSRSRPSKESKKTVRRPAAPKAEKKPHGRPSKFTKALADEICQRLAMGESLRRICSADHMPDESTVRGWAVDNLNNFFPQYTRARDIGLDAMADEVLEISDKSVIGEKRKIDAEGGIEVTTGDMIERARLRFDARRWYLSKLAPKRYGDKVTLAGDKENPVAVKDVTAKVLGLLSDEQLAAVEKAALENQA